MSDLWRSWELCLLALLVWREARGESYECRVQVACSVRDRVRHPKWWGNDYVSVCAKKYQFSSLADPKDPQLTTWPQADDHVFEECLKIAQGVIDDALIGSLQGADSYYDVSIHAPAWATPDKRVGQIGRIVFYNIDGCTED